MSGTADTAGKRARPRLSLPPLETVLDRFLAGVSSKEGQRGLSSLSVALGAPPAEVLRWGDFLARHGLVEMAKPRLGGEPMFTACGKASQPGKRTRGGQDAAVPDGARVLESYHLEADSVAAVASIISGKGGKPSLYLLRERQVGPATRLLLDEVAREFAGRAPLPGFPRESQDYAEEHKRLLLAIKAMLINRVSTLSAGELAALAGRVLHATRGLLDLELYLSDDWIEELAINGHRNPLSLYHRKHGWLITERRFRSEEEIFTLSSAVSRQAGTELTTRHPIVDAQLSSGDRGIATLFPISSQGDTLTIRRFSRNPWTMLHFMGSHALPVEMAALLWQAMQYELNVLVAGGTASGKTSVLNALCAFIPPSQRTVSIEDTREISLPESMQWNWVPLAVRQPNPEGEGEVSMLSLMQSALRMRPDRMIVGEVRRQDQALTMFEAMNTGHAVCSTMHADTAEQAVRRIIEPPMSVPAGEAEALHLVLVQHRDRRTGLRRASELVEVLSAGSAGSGSAELRLNYLWRWLPRKDSFERVSESIRLVEELNLHTGLPSKEIAADLEEKARILGWLLSKGADSLSAVGEAVSRYYQDRESLLEEVRHDEKGKTV